MIRIRFRIKGLMTKIERKKLQLKNFLLSEIAIFLSLVIHKGRLHEKPSALREYPALQNINLLTFSIWVIFVLLDPDPAAIINADP
jgi:hypothetical protein